MASASSQISDSFPHDEVTLVPRFCPRCLRAEEVEAHTTLCEKCGESLRDRGYCPICESYLNQAVGTLCAKHDVPLEEAPTDPDPSEFASRNWVTLETYSSRSAAEGLRIRLEAEGIPTFLDGERMGSAAMYQVATGGVKLQVPEDSLDEARILVSQTWSSPIHDPDDLDDAWDELAPEPGTTLRTAMELLMFSLAVLMGLLVLGAALIIVARWLSG